MENTVNLAQVKQEVEKKMISVLKVINAKECTNTADLHTLKELAEIHSLLRD